MKWEGQLEITEDTTNTYEYVLAGRLQNKNILLELLHQRRLLCSGARDLVHNVLQDCLHLSKFHLVIVVNLEVEKYLVFKLLEETHTSLARLQKFVHAETANTLPKKIWLETLMFCAASLFSTSSSAPSAESYLASTCVLSPSQPAMAFVMWEMMSWLSTKSSNFSLPMWQIMEHSAWVLFSRIAWRFLLSSWSFFAQTKHFSISFVIYSTTASF